MDKRRQEKHKPNTIRLSFPVYGNLGHYIYMIQQADLKNSNQTIFLHFLMIDFCHITGLAVDLFSCHPHGADVPKGGVSVAH